MTRPEETVKTRARYNRIALIYDLIETHPETRSFPWRRELWSLVFAGRVLEVGVGTSKNLIYHRPDLGVVGIDLSERMLERARCRSAGLGR